MENNAKRKRESAASGGCWTLEKSCRQFLNFTSPLVLLGKVCYGVHTIRKAKKTREYSLVERKAFHNISLLLPILWETGAAKKARYCMKKRLLSGLLLLAMLLTLLPTMVLAKWDSIAIETTAGDIVHLDPNVSYADALGDGGSVSYDPKTKTLTLNNANLTLLSATNSAGFLDLNLRLIGTNAVHSSNDAAIYAKSLTITGDGSLTVVSNDYNGLAIELHGGYTQKSGNVMLRGRALTMSGVGMLRLEGGSLKLERGSNPRFAFFNSDPSLELPEGGKLTLTFGGEPKTTKTWEGPISAEDWATIKRIMTDAESVTIERPVEEDSHPSFAEGAILLAGDDNPFRDVRAIDWYYEDVMYAYRRGLMNGTAYARFSPDSAFTRGMLLTILARYDGVRTEKGETWYEAGCDWAAKNGISDGKNPEQAISREEFAEVLYRYAAYLGKDLLASADLTAYLDAGEVSAEALPAMQWAVGEAIVKGADFRLNPQNGTTRAEACAMLHRFFR